MTESILVGAIVFVAAAFAVHRLFMHPQSGCSCADGRACSGDKKDGCA